MKKKIPIFCTKCTSVFYKSRKEINLLIEKDNILFTCLHCRKKIDLRKLSRKDFLDEN